MEQHVQSKDNLLKAIDEITKARLKTMSFDKTIKAIIIDESQSSKGVYQVSQIGAEKTNVFTAYSSTVSYKKGDCVYVTIPEGDSSSNAKFIIGKYVSSDETYYNYVNPLDGFLDVTGNIIESIGQKQWGLTANYKLIDQITIWEAYDLGLRGYDRLCLKAQFKTWLSSLNIGSGTYGLLLIIEDTTGKNSQFDLTNREMYGNPYAYETFYEQKIVLNIGAIEEIRSISLKFVQGNNFFTSTGEKAPGVDNTGAQMPNNIFMKAPYISVGYDVSNFDGEDLRIYAEDGETFNGQEPSEERTIKAKWVHIPEVSSAIVIDSKEKMPRNPEYKEDNVSRYPIPETKSDLMWFRYNQNSSLSHFAAGLGWVEIDDILNEFTYTFNTPTGAEANDLASIKFKAMIVTPSVRQVNYTFTQTKEYQAIETNADASNSDEAQRFETQYAQSLDIVHQIMDGKLNCTDGRTQIDNLYKGVTSESYNNFKKALSSYQVLRSEIKWIDSGELVYANTGYAPSKYAESAIADINISVDPEGLKGKYLIYDDTGYITNASEASQDRYCELMYRTLAGVINDKETTQQDLVYEVDKLEQVTWYIPLESTMIAKPVEGREYSTGKGDEVAEVEIGVDTPNTMVPPGKYCVISRVPQFTGTSVDGDALIAEHHMLSRQYFRIKDFYTQLETNNKIYCRITKESKSQFANGIMEFGVAGTNGTDSTFILKMYEFNDDGTISDREASALSLQTTYYENDKNGNTVKLTTQSGKVALVPKVYDYNKKELVDYFKDTAHAVTYKFYGSIDDNAPFSLSLAESKDPVTLSISGDTFNIQKDYYLVVEAEVPYNITYDFLVYTDTTDSTDPSYLSATAKEQGKKIGDYVLDASGKKQPKLGSDGKPVIREDKLKTYLPVSIIKNKILRSQVAPSTGEPIEDKPELNEYYKQIVGANKVIYDRNGSNAKYYKDPYILYNELLDPAEDIIWSIKIKAVEVEEDSNAKESIRSFYPILTPSDNLQPLETYILSDTITPNFCVYGSINDEIVCVQPVLIIQNKYGSPMLNKWDGSLTIDKKNGIILSSMIGAGIKDENNTFSGVLMGEVSKAFEDNHNGLGLYGFHQNDQSFGFNVNGTAFIGKAGHGRIWFDGNSGTITSGNYTEINDEGKNKYQQGMKIDLDGSDGLSSSIHAFGTHGGFIMDLACKDTKTYPFKFKVFSGHYGQKYDPTKTKEDNIGYERGVICFDDAGEYIQSLNYDGAYHGGTTTNNNGEPIDLWIPPTGAKGQIYAPGADPTNPIVREASSGMFIDLRNGWIDARSGIIGGWKITNTGLISQNNAVQLKSGDPTLSDTDPDKYPSIRLGMVDDASGKMQGRLWIADYNIIAETATNNSIEGLSVSSVNTDFAGEVILNSDSTSESLTKLSYTTNTIVDKNITTQGINYWRLWDDSDKYKSLELGITLKTAQHLKAEDDDTDKDMSIISFEPTGATLALLGNKENPWTDIYANRGMFVYESFRAFNEKSNECDGQNVIGWHSVASQPWITNIVIPMLHQRMKQINNYYWGKTKMLTKGITDLTGVCKATWQDGGADGPSSLTFDTYSVSVENGAISVRNSSSFKCTIAGWNSMVDMRIDINDVMDDIEQLQKDLSDLKTSYQFHTHKYSYPSISDSGHSHSISSEGSTDSAKTGIYKGMTSSSTLAPGE